MSQYAYLAGLLVSLAGLTALDARYRIAVFDRPRAALSTLALAVLFFLLWDVAGVALGIFFIGDSPYLSGVVLAPEVPLEELFFLVLLTYQTLLLWRWLDRRQRGPLSSGREEAP